MATAPEIILQPLLVNDEATLLRIQDLRRRAWAANGEVPEFIARQDILNDEHDVHGLHWVILHEGRPIAAARLCIHDRVVATPDPEGLEGYEQLIEVPIACLSRLVVDPLFQRQGLPEVLRRERLKVASERCCRSVVAVAEEEAVMRPLERHGFVRLGPTRIRYLSYAPSIVLLKRIEYS
jgi:GNAT superfamily N-acetyltransferase